MEAEKIKSEIISVLLDVAPEIDIGTLDPARSFRDQFEVDSVDFVELMLKLEARLGITIPQADYPKLSSLDGACRYVRSVAGMPAIADGTRHHE